MIEILYSENNDFENTVLEKIVKYKKNIRELTKENLELFIGEVDSYNLFNEDSSYVIYGADFFSIKSTKFNKNGIAQLLKIATISNDQFIFVLEKKINTKTIPFINFKDSIIIHEIKDDKETFNSFLKGFIKEKELSIDKNALDALIDGCDENFLLICNELLKCQDYENNDVITIDTLNNISFIKTKNNIFDLINYILLGNTRKSEDLFTNLVDDGQNIVSLLGLLSTQIRLIRQIKILDKPDNETATILKVHPFRIKATKRNITSVSTSRINDIYLKIGEIDYQIKSGKMSEDLVLVYLLEE